MCRSALEYPPNGKRCEKGSHLTPEEQKQRRDKRNATRRARYQAQKAATSPTTSTASPEEGPASVEETAPTTELETGFVYPTEEFNAILDNITGNIASAYADKGVVLTDNDRANLKRDTAAPRERIAGRQAEITALKAEIEALKGVETKEAYTSIQEANRKIIVAQGGIAKDIARVERQHDRYHSIYSPMTSDEKFNLEFNHFDSRAALSKLNSNQITVIGAKNVNLDAVDYSNSSSVRAAIVSSGTEYPAPTYWDEMGSSEKDRWEERRLNAIGKSQKRS